MSEKRRVAREVYDTVNSADLSNNGRPNETKVNIRTAPKRMPLEPNMMVFQKFAFLASTKLKASTNRLLMYFFAISAYENFIGIDIKTLMEDLGFSKPTVVNGLKELTELNIIIKSDNGRDRRRNDYFINPMAAWKGNSYTRKQTMAKLTGSDPKQLDLFKDSEESDKTGIQPNTDF